MVTQQQSKGTDMKQTGTAQELATESHSNLSKMCCRVHRLITQIYQLLPCPDHIDCTMGAVLASQNHISMHSPANDRQQHCIAKGTAAMTSTCRKKRAPGRDKLQLARQHGLPKQAQALQSTQPAGHCFHDHQRFQVFVNVNHKMRCVCCDGICYVAAMDLHLLQIHQAVKIRKQGMLVCDPAMWSPAMGPQ